MIFVDTGYLIALLRTNDGLHSRAVAWTQALREPLLTTEYVLWEAFNNLSAPVERPKIHALLSQIQAAPNWEIVPASPDWWRRGLALHAARPDKEWSLTDCISFALMAERQMSRALAYDTHFSQAGFEALLRRAPEEK